MTMTMTMTMLVLLVVVVTTMRIKMKVDVVFEQWQFLSAKFWLWKVNHIQPLHGISILPPSCEAKDLFASMTAARQDPTADASIVNASELNEGSALMCIPQMYQNI